MNIWPEGYAQLSAWIVFVCGIGLSSWIAGTALAWGVTRLFAALSWWPSYWDWFHHVYLPRYKARKGGGAT